MNKKRYAVLASAVILSLGAGFNVMAADSVRTTTDPAITSRALKNDAAEKEAAGGAAVLGSVHPKMRAAGKKILAICPAIWYTVSVTVVRGWEYARIPGKPFPAAVPLAHKIL